MINEDPQPTFVILPDEEGMVDENASPTMDDLQAVVPTDREEVFSEEDSTDVAIGFGKLKGILDKSEGLPGQGKPTSLTDAPEPAPSGLTEAEQAQDAIGKTAAAGDEAKVRNYADVDKIHGEANAKFGFLDNMDIDDFQRLQSEDLTNLSGIYEDIPEFANVQRYEDLYEEFQNNPQALAELAKASGLSPEDIFRSKKVFVHAHMLDSVNQRMSKFINSVYDSTNQRVRALTDEEVAMWQQLTAAHHSYDLSLRGHVRDAARIMQMAKDLNTNDVIGQMIFDRNMKDLGGRDAIEAEIKTIAMLGDDMNLRRKHNENRWTKNVWNAMAESYRGKLLWNPKTLIRNWAGSWWMKNLHIPTETLVSGAIGTTWTRGFKKWFGHDPYQGDPLNATTYVQEGWLQYQAQLMLMKSGWDSGVQAMKATLLDRPQDLPLMLRAPGSTKIDDFHEPSFTAAKLAPWLDQDSVASHYLDATGRINRAPFAAMAGQDAYMKQTTYGARVIALAYRKARNEFRGNDKDPGFQQRWEELVTNPDADIIKESWEYSERVTFTQANRTDNWLDMGAKKIMGVTPWFIAPFKKTPVNMFNEAMDYTPGINTLRLGKDILAGGAKGETAKAKLALSYGIAGGVYALMSNEREVPVLDSVTGEPVINPATGEPKTKPVQWPLITGGGPSDRTQWSNWYAAGWRPFSIYSNGKYVPYSSMAEPEGTVIGMIASFMEQMQGSGYYDDKMTEKSFTASMTAMLLLVGEYYMDKSMLSGVSDLISSFQNDEDVIGNLTAEVNKRLLFLPAPIGTTLQESFARATDAKRRYTELPGSEMIWAEMRRSFPWLREDLAPIADGWGEYKTHSSPLPWLGGHIMSPLLMSEEDMSPHKRLTRNLNIDVRPPPPIQSFNLMIDGQNVRARIDLRKQDGTGHFFQQQYAEGFGRARREAVDRYIASGQADQQKGDLVLQKARVKSLMSEATQEFHSRFTTEYAGYLIELTKQQPISLKTYMMPGDQGGPYANPNP